MIERVGRARTHDAPGRRAAGDDAPVTATAERREQRVAAGVEELDRWLCDQVAQGLAHADRAPSSIWDGVARRLVDAQAGALASRVRELGSLPADGRPDRLLEEYALLRLLVTAFRRRDELPAPLRATVRSHVGFPVSQEEVLAGDTVRDHWYVAGCRDVEQDRLLTRRVWLRGQETGRPALILSFTAPGQTAGTPARTPGAQARTPGVDGRAPDAQARTPDAHGRVPDAPVPAGRAPDRAGRALDSSLGVGDTVDAELAFYPGALALRALVAARHAAPVRRPPRGTTVPGLLREYADALALDPWLERWPAVLAGVRPARDEAGGPCLVDADGAALPLRASDVWRLWAVSGGRPLTVAGEWSPRGLLPLSAWQAEEGAVPL
ncbi:SWIM zinc finger family protein [Actinoallomurus rhizosphaericola]|uniref:SWIM zinc finger family protein n=1 Tax=Actinoallomurus rhizosphaericola TaxID=2952536 RepID=UPI0020932DE6|nr:SWIM zinc finger family protein [Actinoallomurus rhizosphaericola]MCO5999474.1 SWIM zinc finger family protein [Actinoallomurus rhizosphaericola]